MIQIDIIPNIGFKLNSLAFNWGESRQESRKKLKNQHKESDTLVEMAQFFDGDKSHDIHQKRDIFQNINNSKNYFFFGYNNQNELDEIEIHWGVQVETNHTKLEFKQNIDTIISQLKTKGFVPHKLEEGSFLIKELKISIANSEHSGGEGNGLAYIYSSQNIDHLLVE